MGNGGWYGTSEEWRRIEAPIRSLDPELERFAALHSLAVTRNHKDWPERSLVWGSDVRCLIQLYLDDVETLGINLWICASEDRSRDRYWMQEFLCKGVPIDDVAPCISEFLATTKARLDHWRTHPEMLEFAVNIAKE
jgi:hypothetical protein